MIPSLNASFCATRAHGGAFGELVAGQIEKKDDDPENFGEIPLSGFVGWLREKLNPDDPDSVKRVEELIRFLEDEGDALHPGHCTNILYPRAERDGPVTLFGVHLLPLWNEYIEQQVKITLQHGVHAKPVALPEPDKVRVITAASAATNYAALALQKMMHSTMRRWSVFEYMGHPITEASWLEHFHSKENDEFFLSGDYQAATDNLNPKISEGIWA